MLNYVFYLNLFNIIEVGNISKASNSDINKSLLLVSRRNLEYPYLCKISLMKTEGKSIKILESNLLFEHLNT